LLNDEFLNNYLQDNPSLEKVMLQKHEERIKAHFGEDQKLIQIAWEKGLREAYKIKEGRVVCKSPQMKFIPSRKLAR
jgi:hypothetical protein